jgi:hypothetical protein
MIPAHGARNVVAETDAGRPLTRRVEACDRAASHSPCRTPVIRQTEETVGRSTARRAVETLQPSPRARQPRYPWPHFGDGTTDVCEDVQALIEDRLSDLEKRMTDLRLGQRELKATLKRCRETEWSGHGYVINRLTAGSASHP